MAYVCDRHSLTYAHLECCACYKRTPSSVYTALPQRTRFESRFSRKSDELLFLEACGWSLLRIHFVCGHMFAAPVRIAKICGFRTGAQKSVCGPKAHSPVRIFEKSAPVGDIRVLGCRYPASSRILMLKLLTALPFGNPRGIPGLIRLAE